MDEVVHKTKLKKIYVELLKGYSFFKDAVLGDSYIKHLTIFDSDDMDEINSDNFELAKSRGLPTLEEKEKYLSKDGLWTKEDERKMAELTFFISNLTLTRSKMALKSQIDSLTTDLKSAQAKLNKLSSDKRSLIGMTAESFADRKTNDYYIFATLYSDESLKQRKFSKEEFDEISDESLFAVSTAYSKATNRFSSTTLKRISLSHFFVNAFCLVEDHPEAFFGKPMVQLTFYQNDLFLYGKYFRNMIGDMKHKPAEEIMQDPDKLMEYFNISKNTDKLMDESRAKEGAATTIVGATNDDLKAMGIDTKKNINDGSSIDLGQESVKKGGSLSMEDLLKLHGV